MLLALLTIPSCYAEQAALQHGLKVVFLPVALAKQSRYLEMLAYLLFYFFFSVFSWEC